MQDIDDIEYMLKGYFESNYSGGDFLLWLEEEARNPLGLSFRDEAKLLLEYYNSLRA